MSVDLSVEVAGLKFKNPVVSAAGPISRDGESIWAIARAGAGGVVTKTISTKPAAVPRPCIVAVSRGLSTSYTEFSVDGVLHKLSKGSVILPLGLLNAELWSDLPPKLWFERIYDEALAAARAHRIPLIASIGYTAEELTQLGPKLQEKGVDAIEFSTHYVGASMEPIVEVAKAIREVVDIPVFAKMSPHILEPGKLAKELEKVGVDAIVAINSLGPCLHIDVETGRPLLGGKLGYGWLSGPAIKPVGVRFVAEISMSAKIPVIGVGGIMSGRDVIEYVMAGAYATQICTGAILEGPAIFTRVVKEVADWLKEHGYSSLEDVRGKALPNLPRRALRVEALPPHVDVNLCVGCGICEAFCPYGAVHVRKLERRFVAVVGEEKCYGCGLCVSLCPQRAIRFMS